MPYPEQPLEEDEGYICDRCDGDGWLRDEEVNCACPDCHGDGRVWDELG